MKTSGYHKTATPAKAPITINLTPNYKEIPLLH